MGRGRSVAVGFINHRAVALTIWYYGLKLTR
jgi:hypothetical protein